MISCVQIFVEIPHRISSIIAENLIEKILIIHSYTNFILWFETFGSLCISWFVFHFSGNSRMTTVSAHLNCFIGLFSVVNLLLCFETTSYDFSSCTSAQLVTLSDWSLLVFDSCSCDVSVLFMVKGKSR